MSNPTLLRDLIEQEDTNNILYKCYNDSIIEYENIEDKFHILIEDIKQLSELQYDFKLLTSTAKKFNVSRRDCRDLCDMICEILGDDITSLCRQNSIVVSPSKYEDYCPYSNESLVLYGNADKNYIKYDGKIYGIVDTKLEETPYYTIYCSLLDM